MNTERFNQTLGSERFNIIDTPIDVEGEINLLLEAHSHSNPKLRIDGNRHTLSVDIAVEQFRRYVGLEGYQPQTIDEIAFMYYDNNSTYLLEVVERNINGVAQLLNLNPRRILV
jgi:hypothetical protein